MDPLNDDEQQRLADLDRELSDSDPELARQMAAWPTPTAKLWSFWAAIVVCFVLLGIDAELFLLSLRWHNPILFLLTVAGFPCVTWPITTALKHRPPTSPR